MQAYASHIQFDLEILVELPVHLLWLLCWVEAVGALYLWKPDTLAETVSIKRSFCAFVNDGG